MPRRQSFLIFDCLSRATFDQQVAHIGRVVTDSEVEWSVTQVVLRVHVRSLLNQEVADVVAAELGSHRQQGVPIVVHNVHTHHVSL